MKPPPLNTATFSELQEAAGAEFAVELVQTFFEQAPLMLAELRAAHAEQAADKFRRAAHSLKSNSLTFGAEPLAALARELELGGMPADAAPLDALAAEIDRAVAALKELCNG